MDYPNRVKQITTTTGTGAYDISGTADVAMVSFTDAIPEGNSVYYVAVMGADFERGIGIRSGNTLLRGEILESTNGDNPVAWGVGNKALFCTVAGEVIANLDELNTANGFDHDNPETMGTVTWNNTTRQFTIAPQSGESQFHYWVDGEKRISTSNIVSSVVPDVTGSYYVYLDVNGDFLSIEQTSMNRAIFYDTAFVAMVYWNAVTNTAWCFKDQHGYVMDSATHARGHSTVGALYAWGLALTGLVDGQETFTGINSGAIYDEDNYHVLPLATTLPFLYRSGTGDGEWNLTAADNEVGYKNGGANTVWNEFDGTNWGLTRADSAHDYILYFTVSAPAMSGFPSHAIIIDQRGYSSRNKARAAIEGAQKLLIMDGLPSPEMVFDGVYIVRKNGALENLADGSVYLDLRGTNSRGSGGDSFASNIAADIAVDASGFGQNLSTDDADLQKVSDAVNTLALGDIEQVATDPASPATGKVWINTTDYGMKAKTATGTIIYSVQSFIAD